MKHRLTQPQPSDPTALWRGSPGSLLGGARRFGPPMTSIAPTLSAAMVPRWEMTDDWIGQLAGMPSWAPMPGLPEPTRRRRERMWRPRTRALAPRVGDLATGADGCARTRAAHGQLLGKPGDLGWPT